MGERCGGILERRCPVHERHGAERRLAHRRAGKRQRVPAAERRPPDDRGLHEEVVWMLPIDERQVVERFADLEDLTIAILAERGWLEAQHQRESQPAAPGGPLGHPHPPVLHRELVAAARTSLLVRVEEHDAVLHQMPRGGLHGGVIVRGLCGRLREGQGRKQGGKGSEDPCSDYPRHTL